ncbi:ammonia-forming cytochrome c nitrite reductase subunit c552 [Desulfuribacillus alkaliarsenatis]|uniref:nitrite reductase (cytochrome; ammonia-forming) n=1 Tax=Desulfuribacillus alkaliarsenatis TaxID=766136 RepID=A0A1E5G2G7_9FIRM|nr:ammonia-forming cytochrome c nitrite reductase subunit c552 [Desulfuribacillus alkaliarsenatis]OEF96731.1 cytochrome C nitrite reductase [Desulfuribacillus alkaliarsenatis]
MSKSRLLVVFALVALVAMLVAVGCTSSNVPTTAGPVYNTGLAADEYRNDAFKELFPLHWESYMRNNDDTQMTVFGGSVPHRKNDGVNPLPKGYTYAQPYLKNLWLGLPFMYEYDRARGHTYALQDMLRIDRVDSYNEKANFGAACYSCKTTTIPKYLEKYGDDFWAMDIHELREEHDLGMHTIGCSNCHDPQTMELVITQVALDEALLRLGIDWREAPKNDMRSYVCAQCHIEYYFQRGAQGGAQLKPHFPWDQGFDPQDMYEFFADGTPEIDGFSGQYADWTHPVSGVPLIKIQHPEFEMWQDGPHGSAGVSCSDCHMPYVRVDGKKKISSHHWRSPLFTVEQSCLQCHGDKDAGWAKDRVVYSQQKTWDQLMVAQNESVRAHEAVRLAREFEGEKRANFDELLAEAVELTRKGQLFWDYVSAENSAGFHNPAKALETLSISIQDSMRAVELAKRATNYGIAPQLEGDIKDIVPPILEHSRKLQQSQAHLDSHQWLQYLPLLPEAERLWDDENNRIR